MRIPDHFKISNRFNIVILLGLMSLFCFAMTIVRYYITGHKLFLFLNWNLLLAFIPWIVTTIAVADVKLGSNKWVLPLVLFTWLLFFPNSPYILTDLFHLHPRNPVPLWYDLVLILSFAWTGLALGFLSLMNIELLLTRYLHPVIIKMLSVVLLFGSAFGIYLGRYLRWNSWDIVGNSHHMIYEIGDRIVNPFSHPTTWGVTIFMGVLLNMMYWTFKFVSNRKELV